MTEFLRLLLGWVPREEAGQESDNSEGSQDGAEESGEGSQDNAEKSEEGSNLLKTLSGEPDKFLELIPEDYQKKPYMKGVDGMDKLLKKLDGAQTKLGEKSDFAFPGKEATDEQVSEFRAKAGIPETDEGYEFERPDDYQETPLNKQYETGLRKLYHENHINKEQAKELARGQAELITQIEEANDREFNELAETHFGDKKDEVLEWSEKMLLQNTPDWAKQAIAGMDNKAALGVAAVLNKFASQYMKKDSMPENKGPYAGSTLEDLKAEQQALIGHDAYRDMGHAEHKKVRLQARRVAEQIVRVQNNA